MTPGRSHRRTAIAVLSISACVLAAAAYERRTGGFTPIRTIFPAALGNGQGAGAGQGAGQPRVTINESSDSKLIVGSGKMATKIWNITGFNRLQIGSTFHAKISKGKAFKVTTTADDNILPYVEVEKDGDLLKIGLKKDQSYRLEKSPEAEIVLPSFAGIDLSGASQGHLEGFDAESQVTVHLSGASKLDGTLRSAKAKIETSGASSLTLTGGAQAAEVSGSGASHLKLTGYPLKEGKLDLSGASTADIVVQSTAPFTATTSGASKLHGKLETTELTLKSDGASHVNLDGSAKLRNSLGVRCDPSSARWGQDR